MKVSMEVTGDREVIARMDRLQASMKDRIKSTVNAEALDIQAKAKQQGLTGTTVTTDNNGMGAAIAPLPASYRVEDDAASFERSVEKAVNDVLGDIGK